MSSVTRLAILGSMREASLAPALLGRTRRESRGRYSWKRWKKRKLL